MKSKQALGYLFKVAEKERKQMEKVFSKLIIKRGKSVIQILDCVIEKLVEDGIIKHMEKESVNNTYYKVMGTDIGLLYLGKNKYKMIAVEDIALVCNDFCFSDYDGKVKSYIPKHFGYDKQQEELEVILAYFYKYGKLIPGIRARISPHHKWFRFCALPEMMVTYTRDDHQTLHNALGRYAHNQVLSFFAS